MNFRRLVPRSPRSNVKKLVEGCMSPSDTTDLNCDIKKILGPL